MTPLTERAERAYKARTHIRGGKPNRYAFRRSMKELRIRARQEQSLFIRRLKGTAV